MEAYYRDLLRPVYAGRKHVLTGAPVAALGNGAKALHELGAERSFILGEGLGTGPLPDADIADFYALDVHGDDLLAGIRAYLAALATPPTAARNAVDRYDPDREARAVAPTFAEFAEIAGRRVYGPRERAWAALEDKVRIDAFFDRAGTRRAPAEVVPVGLPELAEAATRLDDGAGTVWAGDAREGFNGGAVYTRHVQSHDDAREATRFFGAHCDSVRVMPFLDGVPCSIHGIVFPEVVVALRPVEMLTLRRVTSGPARFVYCGTATRWDPAAERRDEMRAVARAVGVQLRAEVGYRGAFTVDGVLTATGFLPTEVNTRYGAGMATQGRGVPDLPLYFVCLAVQAGEKLDYRPTALERVVLDSADANRAAAAFCAVRTRLEPAEHPLVWADPGFRGASAGEPHDAVLHLGQSPTGGFVRFAPEGHMLTGGAPLAPHVVAAFAFADAHFGTEIGRLAAAPVAAEVPR